MVAVFHSETVGLSRKQVGKAAVYSVDREKAHAAWRGRKPEEEAQAAKAREGASHSKPYKIRHVNRTSPVLVSSEREGRGSRGI